MTDNTESKAQIVGDSLVISLSIGTLAHAARHGDSFFLCADRGRPLVITDERMFAQSVVRALNREQEDGLTPVTSMLDDAIEYVIAYGEDGVDEAPADAGAQERVKLSDLRGMAPDATGGLSSEEWVRRQRNEWYPEDEPAQDGPIA